MKTVLLGLAVGLFVAHDSVSAAAGKIDLKKVVELHNQERKKDNLPPLTSNPKLEAAAKLHAKSMADRHVMTHAGENGSTPAERIKDQEYFFRKSGENVAAGQTSAKEVMTAWMNSPHHKENILGDFTEIGVACYVGDDNIPYWCVDFGRPQPQIEPEKAASALVEILNKARVEAKLSPLTVNAKLTQAAESYAAALAEAGKFVPTDGDGKTPVEIASDLGYGYRRIGGSVALGQGSADEALKSWLDSPPNRKTFMNETLRHVGGGVATTKEGIPCWSILVAQPAEEE